MRFDWMPALSAAALALSAVGAPPASAGDAAVPASHASGPPAGDGSGPYDVAPADPSSDEKAIAAGREIFNGTCAHCHGPDAEQSVKRTDLRRLRLRYGDAAANIFWKTVHEGRPAEGMPAWKEAFADGELSEIEAFLFSVQAKK